MAMMMIKMTMMMQAIIAISFMRLFRASTSSLCAFERISNALCCIFSDFFSIWCTSCWLLIIYSKFYCI